MHKRAIRPDCPTSSPHTQKFRNLRPHSSPCRVYSRNAFENMVRLLVQVSIHGQVILAVDITYVCLVCSRLCTKVPVSFNLHNKTMI